MSPAHRLMHQALEPLTRGYEFGDVLDEESGEYRPPTIYEKVELVVNYWNVRRQVNAERQQSRDR